MFQHTYTVSSYKSKSLKDLKFLSQSISNYSWRWSSCQPSGPCNSASPGSPGNPSTFSTITSTGGGKGGGYDASGPPTNDHAVAGGSGGGADQDDGVGGTGNTPPVSSAQGKDGGDGALHNSGGGEMVAVVEELELVGEDAVVNSSGQVQWVERSFVATMHWGIGGGGDFWITKWCW